jgi:hypothetical protein
LEVYVFHYKTLGVVQYAANVYQLSAVPGFVIRLPELLLIDVAVVEDNYES